MKVNKLFCFFCSFLFVICQSCSTDNKESLIGGELGPETSVTTHFVDTLSVSADVFRFDSLVTSGVTRLLIGEVSEGTLGKTRAEAFSELSIGSSTDLVFGDATAQFDSVRINLNFDYIFGDSTKALTLNIYELQESIKDSVDGNPYKYIASDRFVGGQLGKKVGSHTFNLQGLEDGTISFFLDKEFGQKIFDQSGKDPLKNQAAFRKFMKGLAFITDPTQQGWVAGMDLYNTSVVLHYSIKESGASDDKRTPRTFTFYAGRRFHYIHEDALPNLKVGSPISSEQLANRFYVLNGSKVMTSLSFPSLKKFYEEKNKGIVLTKAELVFNVASPYPNPIIDIQRNMAPISTLYLGLLGEDNKPLVSASTGEYTLLPAEGTSSTPAQVSYIVNAQRYTKVDLTSYINAEMRGTSTGTKNKGLLLISNDQSVSVNKSVMYANKAGEVSSLNGEPLKMKLLVYYTSF